MPVPFATAKVTATDDTPVLLASWQRTSEPFHVLIRNDSDTGDLLISNSATGTATTAYTVGPRDMISFNVPAGPAYGSSPTESLYVFAEPGRPVTASALIGPH